MRLFFFLFFRKQRKFCGHLKSKNICQRDKHQTASGRRLQFSIRILPQRSSCCKFIAAWKKFQSAAAPYEYGTFQPHFCWIFNSFLQRQKCSISVLPIPELTGHIWLLSIWHVASATKDANSKFYIILVTLKLNLICFCF